MAVLAMRSVGIPEEIAQEEGSVLLERASA
jgi:hypothetical protein